MEYTDLGHILGEYNKKNYSPASIQQYGSNLLGWLKYANIICKTDNGYQLNDEQMNQIKDITDKKIIKIEANKNNDFQSLFNSLTKNYCELFYSVTFINSNQWALTNLKKDDILKIYDELFNMSDDTNKIFLDNAKRWFEEAYETSNKKYLKYSYDLSLKLKK